MIEGRPSQTAAFVAAWRALGDCLPEEVRLCHDPLGWSFSPRIESRTIWHFAASRFGEPLRFGWDPAALPDWLRSRGFELASDRDDDELARELFPAGVASTFRFQGAGGRIAVASPRLSKDGRRP
jgi:O-methyltransferase involved in polyketide biosynthesis